MALITALAYALLQHLENDLLKVCVLCHFSLLTPLIQGMSGILASYSSGASKSIYLFQVTVKFSTKIEVRRRKKTTGKGGSSS
jgi:hypothetical protein